MDINISHGKKGLKKDKKNRNNIHEIATSRSNLKFYTEGDEMRKAARSDLQGKKDRT